MNLLGYFTVLLCAALAVYGQNEGSPASSEPSPTEIPELATTASSVMPATTPGSTPSTMPHIEPVTTTEPPTTTPGTEPPTTPGTEPPTTPGTEPPTTTPGTEPPTTTPGTEPPTTTPGTEPPTTTPGTEPPTTTPGTEPPTTTPGTEPPTTTPGTEPPTTTPGTEPPTTTPGTEPPTTTPSTEPPTTTVPPSDDLNLYVNNSGSFCILMNMEITLTVDYLNATGVNVTTSYTLNDGDVRVNEEKSSNCSGADSQSEEHLVASLKGPNELYVQFSQADNKISINLLRLTFSDLQSIFPDAKLNQNLTFVSAQKLFEYSSTKSYKCDAASKVDLLDQNNQTTNSYVTFKEVKIQAFRTTSDTNFAAAEDCVQDDNVSDIVPIAVGCALAALVVIVLIAYLVGRRQKRQRGYESV